MKTSFYALTAAIAFAAAGAYAAPQTNTDNAVNPESVQINTARPHYFLLPQDFKEFAHTYELETGQIIHFTRHGRHYFAELENETPAEIFPSAHHGFTTSNGVQVQFSEDDNDIAITNFERLPMKVAIAPTGRVIAGR
jgi:hypothetical protein